MINMKEVKKKCQGDYTQIENYEKAVSDKTQTWDCHHRKELHPDGSIRFTKEAMIRAGIYYGRPSDELIFLTRKEHKKLHSGDGVSKETRNKMSNAHKGNKRAKGNIFCEFGRKFQEHFNICKCDNPTLYSTEYSFYRRNNHVCRWEI